MHVPTLFLVVNWGKDRVSWNLDKISTVFLGRQHTNLESTEGNPHFPLSPCLTSTFSAETLKVGKGIHACDRSSWEVEEIGVQSYPQLHCDSGPTWAMRKKTRNTRKWKKQNPKGPHERREENAGNCYSDFHTWSMAYRHTTHNTHTHTHTHSVAGRSYIG